MGKAVTIHFLGLTPIPIGHRVEVRIYAAPGGFLGNTLIDEPGRPLITDLETGVVYSHAWHFHKYEHAMGEAMLPLVVRDDIVLRSLLRGRVTATRVAWHGMNGEAYPMTTLMVAPEDDEPPYR